jgi:hypothetical protein
VGTIPTPPTFAPGNTTGVAANLNLLRDCINFWASPPKCYAYQTAAATLTTGVDTALALAGELYDVVQSGDTPMHDNVTNNSRITIRTAGTYDIGGAIRFSSNGTGSRLASVRLNGVTWLVRSQQAPLASFATDCATPVIPYVLAVGDYLELVATQTSGANLATVAAPEVTFLRAKLTSS